MRGYFLRGGGWLDLIGSLPYPRIFRLFRVLRISRLVREYGFGRLMAWLLRERPSEVFRALIGGMIVS
jgi:hypothetical protein